MFIFGFQSSFSEFDLWNKRWFHVYSGSQSISILIFWVWPLKHPPRLSQQLHVVLFQSSFSEFDLWNPGGKMEYMLKYQTFQSSFSEFDLWNVSTVYWLARFASISILIFWVWPLKRGNLFRYFSQESKFQSSFSEFDLWNIVAKSMTPAQLLGFQSSFSEFDLWNNIIISIQFDI